MTCTAFDKLTGKQQQVAELCLRGFSYTEIADTLKLRPNTVKSHKKNIYDRLNINSRKELFEIAEKKVKGKREKVKEVYPVEPPD